MDTRVLSLIKHLNNSIFQFQYYSHTSCTFDEKGLLPNNEILLVDDYIETCSTFVPDDGLSIPRYTQVRVQVPEEVVDEVNVTLIGTHLGCGHNLYVSPLSIVEIRKWTGRWKTCHLLDVSVDHDQESCFYRCKCLGKCEEIQILKTPRTREESYWTLCHLCLIYNITGRRYY
ncbi:hypothetical protein LSH36_1845g00036 [Paralvinella palmiformis]|uniref:Uncharacterized protein n=1 Tax=Paralvinella palmiformis TaxID=53620 RepID=A0AAD9MLM7_9ANNE|nr:hypothetical protein LSH36_1845g00036 [Paralvinella palmiformis]